MVEVPSGPENNPYEQSSWRPGRIRPFREVAREVAECWSGEDANDGVRFCALDAVKGQDGGGSSAGIQAEGRNGSWGSCRHLAGRGSRRSETAKI